MIKSFIWLAVVLGAFVQCVQSVPDDPDAVFLGEHIFNSTGIFGSWTIEQHLLSVLAPDTSKNCQFFQQSQKKSAAAYYVSKQKLRKGWIEAYVDLSEVDGLGRGETSAVTVIDVVDPSWENVASLSVIKSESSGVSGVIRANWLLKMDTEFSIPSGFHRFTLGFDYDTKNITVYMDDVLKASFVSNQFPGKYSYKFDCGYKGGNDVLPAGTGKLYIKECKVFGPKIETLYVNANTGDDDNDGITEKTPLKTIRAATYKAQPGTVIRIADGVYRESIMVPSGNGDDGYVTFLGTGNNVYMSGAVLASTLNWKKGSDGIWVANVSSVLEKAPSYVTYKNSKGEVVRFRQARTPNYKVETPWKYTEFWNTAMGGKKIQDCFGQDDCDDSADWDTLMLADEAFKTMDDLVGARIFMTDRVSGHSFYDSKIVSHDKTAGTITTDKERVFDGITPGLGMYSQYYVYGRKSMIDEEGEYAYEDGMLYIKWSQDTLPASLEFSAAELAMYFIGTKYVKVINIHFTLYDSFAMYEAGGRDPSVSDDCSNIYIRQCSFDYNPTGLLAIHGTANANSAAHDWHIEYCNFTHCDAVALALFGDDPHEADVGIDRFFITNNYFYDIGFSSESNSGVTFDHVKGIYFINNTVKYVSHIGVSVCFSDVKNGEIVTGYSLFRGNLFDGSCSANSDCGCLKFWSHAENHEWKNTFVTENLCQNTFGWSKTSYNRNLWGERGFAGFGYYMDYASGPVFYRNIAYNLGLNGFHIYKDWEDGVQTTVVNNLVAGSVVGILLGGAEKDQTSKITVKNNVFDDNVITGFSMNRQNYPTPFDKFDVDNNLYYRVGWGGDKWTAGISIIQDSSGSRAYQSFEDLHKLSPDWEKTEYGFDPKYGECRTMYNLSYDDRHFYSTFKDGTFAVTTPLVDKGSDTLPQVVIDMLNYFGIQDVKVGDNYDLGPYEKGVGSWIPSSEGKDGAVDPPYDWSSSGWSPSIPDTPSQHTSGSSHTTPGSNSPESKLNDASSIQVSLLLFIVSFFILVH